MLIRMAGSTVTEEVFDCDHVRYMLNAGFASEVKPEPKIPTTSSEVSPHIVAVPLLKNGEAIMVQGRTVEVATNHPNAERAMVPAYQRTGHHGMTRIPEKS